MSANSHSPWDALSDTLPPLPHSLAHRVTSLANDTRQLHHLSINPTINSNKGIGLETSLLPTPALVPLDNSRFEKLDDWSKKRDVFAEVGMSIETLRRHGWISGQLVRISSGMGGSNTGRGRIVRLVALGFDLNSERKKGVWRPCRDVGYLAPSLVHALGLNLFLEPFLEKNKGGRSTRVKEEIIVERLEELPCMSMRSGMDVGLPTASKVIIQKVGMPQVLPAGLTLKNGRKLENLEDTYSRALHEYFKDSNRFLGLGDIFGVWTAKYGPPKSPAQIFDSENPARKEFIFFRVVAIDPKLSTSLLIDPTKTHLTLQGGNCWGPIPIGLEAYSAAEQHAGHLVYLASSLDDVLSKPPLLETPPKISINYLGSFLHASKCEHPHMPTIGPLLPVWKDVAHLIAPLLHSFALSVEFGMAILLRGATGSGRRTAALAASLALGMKHIVINCSDLKGLSDRATCARLCSVFDRAVAFSPCILMLRGLEGLANFPHAAQNALNASIARVAATLRELIQKGCGKGALSFDGKLERRLVVVMGSSTMDDLPIPIRRCFTHEIEMEPPDEAGRKLLFEHGFNLLSPRSEEIVKMTVDQTAGFSARDIRSLISNANTSHISESVIKSIHPKSNDASNEAHLRNSLIVPSTMACEAGPSDSAKSMESSSCLIDRISGQHREYGIEARDVEKALSAIRGRTATEIGAPSVPNVKWEDVGGLEDVKKVIFETVELPLKHRDLFGNGLRRRSGVLLYGPPGVGKTLIAKAVATECSINFMSVKGPELLNMYIGESERLVREVFVKARHAKPCVVFFDELDALAPARGASGDSAGVMDRVVSQLLAEIDGIQGNNTNVFIFGATNRPDLIDPALLRPGRMDTLVYVGLPSGPEVKAKVLQALTRKFELVDGVDLVEVSRKCPGVFTGADLYALCADAWMTAMKRTIGGVNGGMSGRLREFQKEPKITVAVSQEDFLSALANLKPSLTVEQANQYLAIKRKYETGKG